MGLNERIKKAEKIVDARLEKTEGQKMFLVFEKDGIYEAEAQEGIEAWTGNKEQFDAWQAEHGIGNGFIIVCHSV